MIVTETIVIDGKAFTHTYSDRKLMIRKVRTGEVYLDAYDVQSFAYEEADTQIEASEDGK